MNKSYLAGSTVMGMSIDIVGFAMCCPTCMCDTRRTLHVLRFTELLKVGDFTARFINIQLIVGVYYSHTRTVITTILKAMKPFNQNIIGISVSDVPYNSTHKIFLFIMISRD